MKPPMRRLLFLGMAAAAACASAPRRSAVPIRVTGWSVEIPEGFTEAKSDYVDLDLRSRPDAAGYQAVIDFHTGWRKDPIGCPDKKARKVPPIGSVVQGQHDGRPTYAFSCSVLGSEGALDYRRLFLEGDKLGGGRYLNVTLSFIGKAGFPPDDRIAPALRKLGLDALERASVSLKFEPAAPPESPRPR
jgi:hypothetical protein